MRGDSGFWLWFLVCAAEFFGAAAGTSLRWCFGRQGEGELFPGRFSGVVLSPLKSRVELCVGILSFLTDTCWGWGGYGSCGGFY